MSLLFRSIFIILCGLFFFKKSFGYTNFIGYGYASCLTCHYNAFGNGPLTDYGRALGTNLVAGRLFIPKNVSDSELSEKSGFLFGALNKNNTWLRPSLDYRGIRVTSNAGQSGSDSEVIHMQMDANLVLKFNSDKLITSVSYGLEPIGDGSGGFDYDPISREHYISYAFAPSFRVYGGKMDVIYGVRIPDHIVYARDKTSLNQRDQTHGVAAHYYTEKFELGGHIFAGDLEDEAPLQFSGFSGMGEYALASDVRLGASFLMGSNEILERMLAALHFRMGFAKGASLIGEFGMMDEEITQTGVQEKAMYMLVQSMIKVVRGLHLLTTFEHYDGSRDGNDDELLYRFSFGAQWFPVPRVEFRSELSAERFLGKASARKDNWTFLNQLHLWF